MNQMSRFVAYAILALPALLVHQAAENAWGTGTAGFIGFIALYTIDFWIAAVVHEVGHAVAARRFGWKISYIAVFPLAYHLNTKAFSLWGRSSGDLGGAVAIIAMPGKTKRKVAILSAGGAIANFILAAGGVILAMVSPPSASDVVGSVAVMSLLLGVGNLIPWRARNGSKSDGAMLLSLLKNTSTPKRKIA